MQSITATKPLIFGLIPAISNNKVYQVALVLVGALLLTASSHVSFYLPISPVPITIQTYAVMVIGMSYGFRLGTASVFTWITAGSIGAPVFAGAKAGLFFAMPTGGYIIGFAISIMLLGALADRGWGNSIIKTGLAFVATTIITFALGLLVLAFYVPMDKLLMAGLIPYIPGGIVKAILATATIPFAWKMVNKHAK